MHCFCIYNKFKVFIKRYLFVVKNLHHEHKNKNLFCLSLTCQSFLEMSCFLCVEISEQRSVHNQRALIGLDNLWYS